MAKGKQGAAGRKPKHSNDANRANKTSASGMRDASTVRRLNMYNTKAKRDKKGKIIHEDLQSKELPTTRIQPDRRWFGNTRVIGQKQLEQFREEMSSKVNDAYTVLLREKKLPLQLLEDPERKVGGKQARVNLLSTQSFSDTFGPNRRRKRPKLMAEGYDELVQTATQKEEKFQSSVPIPNPADPFEDMKDAARDAIFGKGQSKRIWGELYKVLDSSNVVIQVLDARDPEGTRCRFLERHIRKNARHKHLILLLNKCDLVPAWVTRRWLHHLSREFPTLAFHASITNPFGKGALLSLLRQLARLRSDKQAISVGFIGYPNVGKSSVINALRTKKVCKTAPVPGETKVWQYITLMKRIFLIDCPGVVYHKTSDDDSQAVLKGVVRVEGLEDASVHVPAVLERVKPDYLRRAYKLQQWDSSEEFLDQLARASGKLLKGGDPDRNTAARMVLYDWQRGKIPFFTLPPDHTTEEQQQQTAAEGAPPGAAGSSGGPATAAVAAAGEANGEAAAGAAAGGKAGLFSEGVTEEDAAGEAGAQLENAAAAARAMREVAGSALKKQRRGDLPVKEGYYLPDDLEEAGAGSSEEEGDEVSSEGGELSSEEGSSGSEEEEESSEEEADGVAAAKTAGEGEEDGSSSGDESDGYGEDGLSWEAVLQAVQGSEAAVKAGSTIEAADQQQQQQRRQRGRKRQQQEPEAGSGSSKGKKAAKKGKHGKLKTLE